MALNEKYSFKNFTGQDLSAEPAEDFNNTIIRGTCFAQEWLNGDVISSEGGKDIFPAGMTGVTFERCNLDNVNIPVGNIVTSHGGTDSSTKVVKWEYDGEDWIMIKNGEVWEPTEPIRKKRFLALGLSINPADISTEKLAESVIVLKEKELAGG
jgi:hypothetical protein